MQLTKGEREKEEGGGGEKGKEEKDWERGQE